jgi:hypothetical protein
MFYLTPLGLDSVVGYSYTLRAGCFGNRIPAEAKFSTPIHTGPGAHPASSTMDTESLSGGIAAGAWR